MMKWTVAVLLAVSIYFAGQNWPAVRGQLLDAASQLPGLGSASIAVMKPDGSIEKISVPLSTESWSQRDVCGLRMNLPFELQPIQLPMPTQMPRGVQFDCYAGKSRTHEVILSHVMLPMSGALPLWIFNISSGQVASRHGLRPLGRNPPTILSGLRAQRSDYATLSNPRIHYRLLLLERANQAWFLETHASESDPAFEPSFQKIAFSVQPL